MSSLNYQRGFSIFEALIYIALFTLVIGGGLISAYSIFEGTARIDAAARRETELNFLMRKLDWALGGGSIIEPDPGEPPSGTLEVLKDGSVYRFFTDPNGAFVMETGISSPQSYQLANQIIITDLAFTHVPGNGNEPAVLEYEFKMAGEVMGPFSHYVRTQ